MNKRSKLLNDVQAALRSSNLKSEMLAAAKPLIPNYVQALGAGALVLREELVNIRDDLRLLTVLSPVQQDVRDQIVKDIGAEVAELDAVRLKTK